MIERETHTGEHRRIEQKPEFPSNEEIQARIEAAEGTPDYDYWVDVEAEAERRNNRDRHQENLSILHGVYYKGTYYHHGVGQPHDKI